MSTDIERRWCEVIRKRKRRGAPLTRRMQIIFAYSRFGSGSWCA